MKRNSIVKQILILAAVLLCACSPKGGSGSETGGNTMIGPRSEAAWQKWEEDQKALKETWGDTEVYAYIQGIMEEITGLNANVVFKEGFSLEEESEELTKLKKLYEDMQTSDEISLKEFYDKLENSEFRWAAGRPLELESIKDQGDGTYDVSLLYYPNADSLMGIYITVKTEEDGKFHTDF